MTSLRWSCRYSCSDMPCNAYEHKAATLLKDDSADSWQNSAEAWLGYWHIVSTALAKAASQLDWENLTQGRLLYRGDALFIAPHTAPAPTAWISAHTLDNRSQEDLCPKCDLDNSARKKFDLCDRF